MAAPYYQQREAKEGGSAFHMPHPLLWNYWNTANTGKGGGGRSYICQCVWHVYEGRVTGFGWSLTLVYIHRQVAVLLAADTLAATSSDCQHSVR